MGNTSSSVTSGVKDQADIGSHALYQLASVGGGELVELAKTARIANDFSTLDRAIREKVHSFLYNGGEGKEVLISELISKRHKERTGAEFPQKQQANGGEKILKGLETLPISSNPRLRPHSRFPA